MPFMPKNQAKKMRKMENEPANRDKMVERTSETIKVFCMENW